MSQGQTKTPAAAKPATRKGPEGNSPRGQSQESTARATADQTAASANGEGAEEAAEVEGLEGSAWVRELIWQAPSWLVSLLFHLALMIILALVTISNVTDSGLKELTISSGEEEDDMESLDDIVLQEKLEDAIDTPTEVLEVPEQISDPVPDPADEVAKLQVNVELQEFGVPTAPRTDLLSQIGSLDGDALSGRTGAAKAAALARSGGSKGSEAAVARALEWLAKHQLPDGGWSFDHRMAPTCRGQCGNPGELAKARNGATGIALLPFLGAGQTHEEGKYKKTVAGGLYYLSSHMKNNGSLWEDGGRMYSHGLASIALCEAYGMTKDKKLLAPAQASLNFICYAQDPVGGGWRYQPRQAGDTSVVGWQLMALKSGHMSYLQVPPVVVQKAGAFLDSVQSESGAKYGYATPGGGHGTTAVGLLSRMYLGWKKGNPALQRGVQAIDNWGFSHGNMYYNYYATQIARHWGGDVWEKWNDSMRDWLVEKQVRGGHEAGSWYFSAGGDHGKSKGGRLYCTAMATMMLEVYYRHLPIYRKQSTEDEFPVD